MDVAAAISRIEESRRSHQAWVDHLEGGCEHCAENGPPPYIQTLDEHRQIVAEYDNVLACLHALKRYDPTMQAMQLVLGKRPTKALLSEIERDEGGD